MAVTKSNRFRSQSPTAPIHSTEHRQTIRPTVFLVGAIGVAATAVIVTQAEMVLSSVRIGYLQLPPVALGMMLIVVAINRGLKSLWARLGLTSSDLLVVYTMMLVGAMVSSHGIVQKWIPLLVAMKYGQNNANGWHQDFDSHIPARLVPWDPRDPGRQNVVDWFYNKLPRGESIPWGAWVVPLVNWGILVALVVFAFLCLTTILRKQWVDNEKLSFPLAQLPLEIAGDEEHNTLFRSRLMWIGALIPIVIYGIKGLHQVLPTVPDIPLQIIVNDYLTVPPWNGLAYTAMILSFAALGFFFLLPTDVIFSIWFFFLLARVEQLVAISFNMETPGMPVYPPPLFIGYQTMGAYIVLVGYFFWLARPHLAKVWAAAIGREKVDDSQELMPYRVAVWGLFGAIIASSIWLYSIGMSLWLALFELIIFIFVTAVVMARSTAEAGMLMTETTFRPIDLFRMVGSIHALGPANLTALAFFDNMFLRDQRGLILTGMLDGARISDGTHFRRRSFVGVFALGIFLAVAVAGSLNIFVAYHLGGTRLDNWMAQGSPTLTFQDYGTFFSQTPPIINGANWQMPTFFGVGALMTVLLTQMRSAFSWWPLHPLGYALAGSWSTVEFWFPCLLAWIIKSIFLRYGGMSFYQKARPFFLGLVLGEFSVAVFYVLLNMLSAWLTPDAKIPPPAFPWG